MGRRLHLHGRGDIGMNWGMSWPPGRALCASLRGQTLIIMLAGLLVSHGIVLVLYWGDRDDAVVLTEAEDLADHIAAMTVLVSKLPPDMQAKMAQVSRGSMFRISVDTRSAVPLTPPQGRIETLIEAALQERTAGIGAVATRVRVAGASTSLFHEVAQTGAPADRPLVLDAAIQRPDGRWFNITTRLSDRTKPWPTAVLVYTFCVTSLVLAVSVWMVGRVTRPLKVLAAAAEGLGRDINREPLNEDGPVEVAQAARALNAMQGRLRRLIDNRTQMLAAISHDLRTPVTLLRLRAEMLPDAGQRERILATLEEMDAMTSALVAFARQSVVEHEVERAVDVAALLDSLCADRADAGQPVSCAAAEPAIVPCRPQELRRALTNIIDNALTYAGSARARVIASPRRVTIAVEDDGPGIPEAQLPTICHPFVRGESSRNRDTGGLGLGLAIAQTIIEGHGGELHLANRPEGGLRVLIRLPR
ncbi:MAG: HAMP domain-containing protein [Rhodospirillales bacterium]|nr:MAG: HAMP domain-containing protein [Rhodospirillales bacterium]